MKTSTLSLVAHAKTGLPRPIHEDKHGVLRPVPWSQDGGRWGLTDQDRLYECTEHASCLVCGDRVTEGVVLNSTHWRLGQLMLFATLTTLLDDAAVADGGPLHDRCMKITRAHCRSVRESLQNGTLVIRPFMGLEPKAPAESLTATPASPTFYASSSTSYRQERLPCI